jgi:uncharacterized protein with von Willebrand factor type A (vWA) domain
MPTPRSLSLTRQDLQAALLTQQVRALLGAERGTLAAHLVGFARLLRAADFDITAGRIIDAARALTLVDIARPEDVRLALRANLVSEAAQLAAFDRLFDLYWRSGGQPPPIGEVVAAERRPSARRPGRPGGGTGLQVRVPVRQAVQPTGDHPEATAGTADLLTTKDFAGYTDEEVARARAVIRRLAPKLATALARRTRQARRGDDVDLRRSLRRAVRHGGEVLDLLRRRRRVRRLRVVLLCDVSGSMDAYARYLVQFLYAVQNELRGVSTFVFSTRLNEITPLLRTRDYDQALARLAAEVDSWSGGTSIGGSLAAFEREYARRRVDSRTVVIIISDGWERGDVEVLRRALSNLKRRAYKLLWLNPLLGAKDYRPLARGMAAALPYLDYFLPAHNLDSLVRVARTLEHLARA